MKLYLLIIAVCLSFCSYAQTKWYKDGQEFKSCFQQLEKGDFNGNIVGVMLFEYMSGDKFLSTFSKDTAQLSVEPDPNKIYDVSSKNYTATNNELQLLYRTYGYANALKITIEGKDYYLNLIDGACDEVINGLDYEYISNESSELLIVYFSDNVGLCPTKCYTSPELFVKKGSTLVFNINK